MRKSLPIVAFSFLSLLVTSTARAQGKFTLEYRFVKDAAKESPIGSITVVWLYKSPVKPPQLKGGPKNPTQRVSYFVGQLGEKELLAALEHSEPPKLFADTDRDGDLSDEQSFNATKLRESRGWGWFSSQVSHFGPINLAVLGDNNSATSRVLVDLYGEDYLLLHPAGYLTGKVRLGEESYRIALVDSNFDGQYTCTSESRPSSFSWANGCDYLAIDFNKNGIFENDFRTVIERQPFTKMIGVNGKYYSLALVDSGSAICLEEVTPKLGTLDVGTPHAELMLFSENGFYHLKGSEGKWQLPTGKYYSWILTLNSIDKNKDKWTLRSFENTGKLKNFEISEGNTLAIKIGPPFTIEQDVEQTKEGWIFKRTGVSIGYRIVGQAGEKYEPAVEKNGTRIPAPRVKILDKSGKVLATGKFEYG